MDVTFPQRYHKAVEYMDKTYGDLESSSELDNLQKLIFYALRKQAEVGPCNEPAPSMWYLKEKYKHDAWKQLKSMSKFEAMVHYVKHLDDIKTGWIHEVLPETASSSMPNNDSREIDLETFREPNARNIDALISEVHRLRQLLRDHNIPSSSPSVADDSTPTATPSSHAVEHVPGSEVVPPVKPVPQSYSADVVPPTKPTGVRQEQSEGKSRPVYYTPKKLTWLEWLGIISVDDVASRE